MKSQGWIDPDGKWHGVKFMGHVYFAINHGFGNEEDMRDAGWIQCSGTDHVFASRRRRPTQAQQDRVMRYLKRECMSKYDFKVCWEQFARWYLEDYGGSSDAL